MIDREAQEKIANDISSEISFKLGLLIGEFGELFDNYPDKFNKIMLELGRTMADKGYRKPPKDKPPLLSDNELAKNAIVCWVALEPHEQKSFQLVAQAQRESDIKFYGGEE